MSSFFRKALGLFVVLEDPQTAQGPVQEGAGAASTEPELRTQSANMPAISQADLTKFEKHFSQLFDQTNLPGPDYYEFWKTMDTLEALIPDEKARIQAVYASLKIQGLTKKVLIDSAGKYKEVVLQDKASFESAVQQKSQNEITGRQQKIQQMEKDREEKRRLIEKLQQEIEDSAGKINTLQKEIADEQGKIESAQRGYLAACSAMVSKIESDMERFQQIVE